MAIYIFKRLKQIINEEIISFYDENDDLVSIDQQPKIKRNKRIYNINEKGHFKLDN